MTGYDTRTSADLSAHRAHSLASYLVASALYPTVVLIPDDQEL